MPDYQITAPDGAKYKVTAPEGARAQDVLAYVQKQVGHQSIDITINVYGHFMPGGNRAAV